MKFLLLLLPILSWAGVVKDDVSTVDKINFSLKSVCLKMVTHESPLIEIVSGTEIDCMGKKVSVSSFCEKEMAQNPYYLRAYIDRDKKEVICHTGKKVIFKYQCVKLSDKSICRPGHRKSCEDLKIKLARRLDIVHTSYTKNEKGIKELNCFFESLPLQDKADGRI